MGANSRQWSRTMGERLALDVPAEDIERDDRRRRCRAVERTRPPAHRGCRRGSTPVGRHGPTRGRLLRSSRRHRCGPRRDRTASFFSVVVSSDEVEHGKPAPDVYLEAARRLGHAVGVRRGRGFAQRGPRRGCARRMRVVLVPNASVPPAPGAREAADLVIDSLRTSIRCRSRADGAGISARGARSGRADPVRVRPFAGSIRCSGARLVASAHRARLARGSASRAASCSRPGRRSTASTT